MIVAVEQTLKENYYALYLAIRKNVTVTEACSTMDIYPIKDERKEYQPLGLIREDLEKAIEMKSNGSTWQEVGDKLEVNKKSLFNKVKKYMGSDWDNREW